VISYLSESVQTFINLANRMFIKVKTLMLIQKFQVANLHIISLFLIVQLVLHKEYLMDYQSLGREVVSRLHRKETQDWAWILNNTLFSFKKDTF
jgi:hypothetical protein